MRQEVAGSAAETDPAPTLTERVAAARSRLADNAERLAAAAERLRATRTSLASGRSRREQLHESAYARRTSASPAARSFMVPDETIPHPEVPGRAWAGHQRRTAASFTGHD